MKNAKKGIALWNKAKTLIPGGTQLLSKRSEMFLPNQWPSYFTRAKGITIRDLDGNTYKDMSTMALGSCLLGYADPDVNKAVKKVIDKGSMSTLNSPEEVELAKLLVKLHPWADMVRYARTGGEAMAVAIRIARAYTGKDVIAFCGYHGWSDWYLAANLANKAHLDGQLLEGLKPLGVPRRLKGTALPFRYNHIGELKKIVREHDIGVIVIEPIRHQEPRNNFLRNVRRIADKINATLVFDEISAGWRLANGGSHILYNVSPDIAVFAKALGNGYPMAAIIGREKIMQKAQDTFISSTYWTERIGPTAALATIKKLLQKRVPHHVEHIGKLIGKGWHDLAKKHALNIDIQGPPCLITFLFNYGRDTKALQTIFTQEMMNRGFLASQTVYVSYSHKPIHVNMYLTAVDKVFAIISKTIKEKTIKQRLQGPPAYEGFQRLT
jgi:glutamate-1-semialdehyde 2,1-aminomutase